MYLLEQTPNTVKSFEAMHLEIYTCKLTELTKHSFTDIVKRKILEPVELIYKSVQVKVSPSISSYSVDYLMGNLLFTLSHKDLMLIGNVFSFQKEMLEREEEQREQVQQHEIELEIEKEKKKDDCLLEKIREKAKDDQYNLSLTNASESINSLKEEAQQSINIKRQEIKKKLLIMKKRNKRKLASLKGELMSLRTEVADKLQKVSRAGNSEKCTSAFGNEEKQKSYCEDNFNTDFNKLVECKNNENFCYTCCENEYGELYVKNRDGCYNQCDKLKNGDNKSASTGKWVYSPKIEA